MKIKAILIINLGLYMDIRPEIEIEVPEGLEGKQLVQWLHAEYKGLLEKKNICEACGGTAGNPGEPIVNGLHPKCRQAESFKGIKKKETPNFYPEDHIDESKGEKIINIEEE